MKRLISYPVIFLSILLGFIFPQGKALKATIPYVLAFILFIGFIKEEFKITDLKRKEIFAYGIISLMFMPFFSFFAFKNFFDFDFRIGLFLIAITPTGFAMTGLVDLIKNGDKKLVISNLFIFTFMAAFTIPLLTYLFFSAKIEFDVSSLILKLCYLIFIPWFISKIIHKYIKPVFLKGIQKYSYIISLTLLFILIYVAVASASKSIELNYTMSILFAAILVQYFIQALLGYLAGIVFFKHSVNSLTAISASKNTQFALIVALINFGHKATIPCVIAIIGNHITFSILLFLFYLRDRRKNI